MSRQRIRLWDLPTRIFHGSLVALSVASLVSGSIGGNLIPLGALSVFALLGRLSFQTGSGLFANDDTAFRGLLRALVSGELRYTFSSFLSVKGLRQTGARCIRHSLPIAPDSRLKRCRNL